MGLTFSDYSMVVSIRLLFERRVCGETLLADDINRRDAVGTCKGLAGISDEVARMLARGTLCYILLDWLLGHGLRGDTLYRR